MYRLYEHKNGTNRVLALNPKQMNKSIAMGKCICISLVTRIYALANFKI